MLGQVALGRTNRQIGEELYISEKTVSVHLSRVMAKLGVGSRTEAVAAGYDRGLLGSDGDAHHNQPPPSKPAAAAASAARRPASPERRARRV